MAITTTTESWLALLLQTSDPLFPTGAYAHSFGLEEMVSLGVVRDEESLAEFICNQALPGLSHLELPLLRAAHGAAVCAEEAHREMAPGNFEKALERLCAMDADLSAWKIAKETREASAQIGDRRLKMLLKIASTPLMEAFASRGTHHHHLVVFAIQMAHAPLEATLTAYLYQALAAFCSAALKLIRIGQEGCQRVLSRCMARAEEALRQSQLIGDQRDSRDLRDQSAPGWFNPLWEIASMRHEFAYERLFIS